MRQYRPLYKLKWSDCLDALEADIICFQETKITRKHLLVEDREVCLPKGYHAFYNLHPTKGYSGTATFVKESVCTPQRAEEGITGNQVKDKRDSKTAIGGYPDLIAPESSQFDLIDREGRAVVVDCGMFVLFNLYCPNETDEGRREYKMAYYTTLEERVQNLLEAGREVIIVGDLNIAHLPIDHADSVHAKMTADAHLDHHPARRWLDRFLLPVGRFMDAARHVHPRERFMYTCWNTIKNSRASNYGARIDYTLLSPGLVDWVKDAGIQPDVQGSDHCPVYVDLHDELVLKDGSTVKLRDRLSQGSKPPALATTSWPEHSGRRIQSFFAAKSSTAAQSTSPSPGPSAMVPSSPSPSPLASGEQGKTFAEVSTREQIVAPPSAKVQAASTREAGYEQAPSDLTLEKGSPGKTPSGTSVGHSKRATKAAPAAATPSTVAALTNGSAKKGGQQATLKSFFGKPLAKETAPIVSQSESEMTDRQKEAEVVDASPPKAPTTKEDYDEREGERDEIDDSGAARVQSSLAWGSIFARESVPCPKLM